MRILTAEPCESCGYDRRGQAPAVACPECGVLPEALRQHRKTIARNTSWCACVLAGILMVCLGSALAIDVIGRGDWDSTFYGWRGQVTGVATVIGVPGPRVWTVAMLQRSIGDVPGPLGTRGMIAAFCTFAGFMLITTRPADERRGIFRKGLRWGGALVFGAMVGHLMSNRGISYYGSSESLATLLSSAIGLGDGPLSVGLWFYLATLAGRLREPRLRLFIERTAWLVALGMAGVWLLGTVLPSVVDWRQARQASLADPTRISAAGVAMVAGLAGVLSWIAAGSLILRFLTLLSVPRRVAVWLRKLRWPAGPVAGRRLGAWLFLAALVPGLTAVVRLDYRVGLLANLPMINFPGPKIWSVPLVSDFAMTRYSDRSDVPDVILPLALCVLAVWLLTEPTSSGERHSLRRVAARWWAVVGAGLAITTSLLPPMIPATSAASARTLQLVLLVELPATVLLFIWLGTLNKRWNILAALVGVMIALPQAAFVLSAPMLGSWNDAKVNAVGLIYGGAAAVLSAIVATTLIRTVYAKSADPS